MMHNFFASIRTNFYNQGAHLLPKYSFLRKIFFKGMAPKNSTPIDDISILSPAVCRILGKNPGPYTLQGTNTYLVGTGLEKILIDVGEPDNVPYIENLDKALGDDGEKYHLNAILITHWHFDHIGGISAVLKKFSPHKKIPVYKLRRTDGQPESNLDIITFVDDRFKISVPGASLMLIHTPGHTSDHASIYFTEENAIFSGDCILGEGTAVFEDLHSLTQSLRTLLALSPSKLYPGHGPLVEDAGLKISEYIQHREKREKQILDAIQKAGQQGLDAMSITRAIYPEDLPFATKLGALGNVKHHLGKLIKDKRVIECRSIYTLNLNTENK